MRLEDLDTLSDEELRNKIIKTFEECPNCSCVKSALNSKVIKHLGLMNLRGTRRDNFEKRINRLVGTMKRSGYIEEYSATNVRLRLISGSDVVVLKHLDKLEADLDRLEVRLLKNEVDAEQYKSERRKLLLQAIVRQLSQ